MTPRLLRHPRQETTGLGQNAAHRFAASQALVCYPTKAIYTFIPKNACTTLRLSLAIANGCISGPEDWTWIHPNNGTFSATLRDLATAHFTFVILRCPHARLASVFLDKIVGKTPEFWNLYRLCNDDLDENRLSFRQFVDVLGKPRMRRANIHWRPQVDFLVYDRYDACFPFERFQQSVPEIEAGAGFTIHDTRHLARHGTDQLELLSDGCYADMPLSDLAAMKRDGTAPAHAALYDEALVRRVAELYADDLAFYADRFGEAELLFPNQT
jgi:hypothetical protein